MAECAYHTGIWLKIHFGRYLNACWMGVGGAMPVLAILECGRVKV